MIFHSKTSFFIKNIIFKKTSFFHKKLYFVKMVQMLVVIRSKILSSVFQTNFFLYFFENLTFKWTVFVKTESRHFWTRKKMVRNFDKTDIFQGFKMCKRFWSWLRKILNPNLSYGSLNNQMVYFSVE